MADNGVANQSSPLPPLIENEPSIRLMRISKTALAEQSLSYEVKTFTLAQCPPYKALSYTWGRPFSSWQVVDQSGAPFPPEQEFKDRNINWETESHNVECNGSSVPVLPNLFEAITQLSTLNEDGWLWIDRICIDQSSDDEKSNQVPLMPKIYEGAKRVLIWLGRSGSDSIAAKKLESNLAGRMYDLFQEGKLTTTDMLTHDPTDPALLGKYSIQTVYLEDLFAWSQLFRRTWFFRCWTFQESSLHRYMDVICGNEVFDWFKMNFLVKYICNSKWSRFMAGDLQPVLALMARDMIDSIWQDFKGWEVDCRAFYGALSIGTALCELLHKTRLLQCSHPLDNIYSLLGTLEFLVEDPVEVRQIVVNYKLKPHEQYIAAAKLCLETVPDLAILSFIQDPSRRSVSNLPSWAPDFHDLDSGIALGILRVHSKPARIMYNAGYRNNSIPRRVVEGEKLHLRGHFLGEIIETAADLSDEELANPATLERIMNVISCLPDTSRNGDNPTKALWKTMTFDCHGTTRPAPVEYEKHFLEWVEDLVGQILANPSEHSEQLRNLAEFLGARFIPKPKETPEIRARLLQNITPENIQETFDKVLSASEGNKFIRATRVGGKTLFATNADDIGVGPFSSAAGDQVWVLENGKVPFALRQLEEAQGFEVVGECYVHGVMDGELFANGELEFNDILLV